MISALEAFQAVNNKKTLNPNTYKGVFDEPVLNKINELVVHNINRGWLAISLADKIEEVELSIEIKEKLIHLGYIIDNNFILYWMYDSLNLKDNSTNKKGKSSKKTAPFNCF